MKNGLFAVINIGASAFRMHISEYANGHEKLLEYLVKPLSLGRDTFSKGYISLENVYKSTKILESFKNKIDEYRIGKNYCAVCTSGVREAQNRYFFLDHAKIHTGLDIKILNSYEEIYIKFLGIKHNIEQFSAYEEKGLLFANISSGNIALSIHKGEKIIFSASLPYGSLRVNEIFKDVSVLKKYKAYEQYIYNMFYTIRSSLPFKLNLFYIISSGSSIDLLTDIIKSKRDCLKRKTLEELYHRLRTKNSNEIVKELGIRSSDAEVLLPVLIIYLNMMDFAGKDRIYFSKYSFPYILSLYYTSNIRDRGYNKRLRNTFYYIGDRYGFDRSHAKIVSSFSLKLFDSLKQMHLLKLKERLLLEGSAILHDIGYFIDAEHHEEHSYYITKSLNYPGLSKGDINIIAIINFMHREVPGRDYDTLISSLPVEKRLLVFKLASLLRVADSLDSSHMQLIKDFTVTVDVDSIIIKARTLKHPFLEHLAFDKKSKMFIETFGVKIFLETKILYE